jgi:hypothetical protein
MHQTGGRELVFTLLLNYALKFLLLSWHWEPRFFRDFPKKSSFVALTFDRSYCRYKDEQPHFEISLKYYGFFELLIDLFH